MRTSQRRPDDEAIIRTELETETPGSSSDETLLEAKELNMHYGDDRALDSIAARAEIDDRCERASELVIRDLMEADLNDASSDRLLAEVSRVLLTICGLERVGDHAVNVAARTLSMTESDDELIY